MLDARTTKTLVARAKAARRNAFSTHKPKQIKVGAALLASDGSTFTGCNISNDASTLGVCAERVAVYTAVAAGRRRFRAIAVVANGKQPWSPCGACRQVLSQFDPRGSVEVIMCDSSGRRVERAKLRDLYPKPFRVQP